MVVMLLPLSEPTLMLLGVYDTLICIIFLIDFFFNLRGSQEIRLLPPGAAGST